MTASDEMAARGAAYTEARRLAQGLTAILHAAEIQAVLDASDALLFGEEDAAERQDEAVRTLQAAADAESRGLSAAEAQKLAGLLEACGARQAAAV